MAVMTEAIISESNMKHFRWSYYIFLFIFHISYIHEICLTSAAAQYSELQRLDASSYIFQLMYT